MSDLAKRLQESPHNVSRADALLAAAHPAAVLAVEDRRKQ